MEILLWWTNFPYDWKELGKCKVNCEARKDAWGRNTLVVRPIDLFDYWRRLQGQVAKHNYSLRSNSVKHFLPELTHFCIMKCKNIAPLNVCRRKVRRHFSLMKKYKTTIHFMYGVFVFFHQRQTFSFVLSWLRLSVEYRYYLEG